jgi:hypothetical protein
MKWQTQPQCSIAHQDISNALKHLRKAVEFLGGCRKVMHSGIYDVFFAEKLTDCWREVSRCRTYTDKIGRLEEVLVPAMGEISNAKSMFDSLVVSNLGMTRHGYNSIMRCIRSAELGIRPCIRELENWQKPF